MKDFFIIFPPCHSYEWNVFLSLGQKKPQVILWMWLLEICDTAISSFLEVYKMYLDSSPELNGIFLDVIAILVCHVPC